MLVSKAMEVFITLAQEKNLQKAASRLCLTVPPVIRMLRNTESWFGERLIISERNKITLTPAGESLYQKILPCYNMIRDINTPCHKNKIIISSPVIHFPFMTSFTNELSMSISEPIEIKQTGEIHDKDDIFIDFKKNHSGNFRIFTYPISLNILIKSSNNEAWLDVDLLAEREIFYSEAFQKMVFKLREKGYKGNIHQNDNAIFRIASFESGKAIILRDKMFFKNSPEYQILDNYIQPLYVHRNIHHNHPVIDILLKNIQSKFDDFPPGP